MLILVVEVDRSFRDIGPSRNFSHASTVDAGLTKE
jgi:hypothetical protein